MTAVAPRDGRRTEEQRRRPWRAGRIETVVTIASLGAIALLVVVDLVRTAPPDTAMVEATFDVAPPDTRPLAEQKADLRWAGNEAAPPGPSSRPH